MANPLVSSITAPKGFKAAGGTCGIKASGQPDLALIVADSRCDAAGVFTRNAVKAAPVLVDRKHLSASGRTGRAILCNSGNANGSTGQRGLDDARQMCQWVAQRLDCPVEEVYVCSTGIIGRLLPMKEIEAGIADLFPSLAAGAKADAAAARAILTTDLAPKSARRTLKLGRARVELAGICKGSGMIGPNMATMLVFLTTDAAIESRLLQQALNQAIRATFNRISVDQHTSCSDTVLVLASGQAQNTRIVRMARDFNTFTAALTDLCRDLAYQIVRDGEGATKVFRVAIRGARSVVDADKVGRAITNSPLVKTAVHGSDPNWGRITTAAGYSGATLHPDRMTLTIGPAPGQGICVFRHGQPTAQGLTPPAALKKIMRAKDISFTLDLGQGSINADWLGCDLSREYIRINADYTT